MALPAFLVLAIGAFAQSASAKYLLVKLKESSQLRRRVRQGAPAADRVAVKKDQFDQARRVSRRTRHEVADEQRAEIATWPAGADGRTTPALSAELANEVAAQSKLQLCKGAPIAIRGVVCLLTLAGVLYPCRATSQVSL